MKIVCECGRECEIQCPPRLFEITRFVLAHSTSTHRPATVTVVCQCGVIRFVGPGLLPKDRTEADIIRQGKADGEWYAEHGSCGLPCQSHPGELT